MRTQRKNNVMLDLQILCICKVVDLEELLDLLYTLCSQVDDFILLIFY